MADYRQGFNDGLARAAAVVLDLENRWRQSAQKIRQDGSYTTGWFRKKTCVFPKWEQAASDIEEAINGLKAIRTVLAGQKLEEGVNEK